MDRPAVTAIIGVAVSVAVTLIGIASPWHSRAIFWIGIWATALLLLWLMELYAPLSLSNRARKGIRVAVVLFLVIFNSWAEIVFAQPG